MLFNSFIFLIFLAVVVPMYLVLPRRVRNPLLLVASYFFYGYWDWRFTGLLLLSTVIDFFVGARLARTAAPRGRRTLLLLSLCTNLGILGFFKYFNFFVGSFEAMIVGFGMHLDFLHLNIILPVGISFYTFQTLTYTIDIYRRKLEPTKSFVDFAVYVAFFPQLVAGPIERASHLLPQIEARNGPTSAQLREGIVLITVGMFKKVLIGDTCGRIVDQIFAGPQHYMSIELVMGLVLFALQIYNDFSGYSHIARGTAKLLGKDLMINFDQPYLSASITEFWRRWHISLSTWLRDYLYIPLGGNRKGPRRTYVNLMLTMLLGGLWHGASWNFVVWGGLHGVYLAAHKLMLGDRKPAARFGGRANTRRLAAFSGKVLGTNLLVLFTWLFFRAKSFSTAFYFITHIAHWTPSEFAGRVVTIMLSFVAVTVLIDALEYTTRDHAFLLRLGPAVRYGIIAVSWVFCLLYLYQARPMPFVYFQF